jgi:hypothetical protein
MSKSTRNLIIGVLGGLTLLLGIAAVIITLNLSNQTQDQVAGGGSQPPDCEAGLQCTSSLITGSEECSNVSGATVYCCPSGQVVSDLGNECVDPLPQCESGLLCTSYLMTGSNACKNVSNATVYCCPAGQVISDSGGACVTPTDPGDPEEPEEPEDPGSCSGMCIGPTWNGIAMNNCGTIGKFDATGSCSGGAFCCKDADTGGGGCAGLCWTDGRQGEISVDPITGQPNFDPLDPATCPGRKITARDGNNASCANATPLTRPDCFRCFQCNIGGSGNFDYLYQLPCDFVCPNGANNAPACNTCPSGKTMFNGQCVNNCTNGANNPPSCNTCPSGQTLINGSCVVNCTNGANNPPTCNTCPSGQTLVNGACVNNCTNGATNPTACNICPAGQVIGTGGSCVNQCTNGATNPPGCNTCPTGYTLTSGTCVAPCANGAINSPACTTCPSGKTMVNGQCVNNCTNGANNPPTCNTCPTGQTLVNNVCYGTCTNGATNAPSCSTCPNGKTMVNGQCVTACTNGATNAPTCNICPAGLILINNRCSSIAIPNTAIISDDVDPLLFGILFIVLGLISLKFNIPLKLIEAVESGTNIFRPNESALDRQLKEVEKKRKKSNRRRKGFEDRFDV